MTEEQQRKIDSVARLVADARRRANHDDKVALTILATELHDARTPLPARTLAHETHHRAGGSARLLSEPCSFCGAPAGLACTAVHAPRKR